MFFFVENEKLIKNVYRQNFGRRNAFLPGLLTRMSISACVKYRGTLAHRPVLFIDSTRILLV